MHRRACDRCHSIRARCQFDDGGDACERCLRLGHDCNTARRVLKAGRPRKNTADKKIASQESVENRQPFHNELHSQLSADVLEALQDLDPHEVQLAINFLQNQRFENSFSSDGELSASMQAAAIRQFLSAPGRIKDALLALAGIMTSQDQGNVSLGTEEAISSMNRCCKAMERLREADIASVDDAKATLFVATTLISFNDMTTGHGFLPIARAALLSVEPWYRDLLNPHFLEFDPHLIPVVFAEVSECVRLREVPTFRYIQPVQAIDASYGIAQEILPQLYDVCVLSHGIKTGLLELSRVRQEAAEIHEAVEKWTPKIYMDVEHVRRLDLSELQKSDIIRHGECYKLLALLLLHQLHPALFGSGLSSMEIANEIRNKITTSPSQLQQRVQYLLFPYFIACTEFQDDAMQVDVLAQMEYLSGGIATQSCNRMHEFLRYLWAIRSVDPGTSWFDLVEDGIQFSIGP